MWLLWPLELEVESGMSSEGSSQPTHDFFELEAERSKEILKYLLERQSKTNLSYYKTDCRRPSVRPCSNHHRP